MEGYVQEDLLTARRRTLLHLRVTGKLDMPPNEVYLSPASVETATSEEEHAETLPSGIVAGALLLVLGLIVAVVSFATLLGVLLRMVAP